MGLEGRVVLSVYLPQKPRKAAVQENTKIWGTRSIKMPLWQRLPSGISIIAAVWRQFTRVSNESPTNVRSSTETCYSMSVISTFKTTVTCMIGCCSRLIVVGSRRTPLLQFHGSEQSHYQLHHGRRSLIRGRPTPHQRRPQRSARHRPPCRLPRPTGRHQC